MARILQVTAKVFEEKEVKPTPEPFNVAHAPAFHVRPGILLDGRVSYAIEELSKVKICASEQTSGNDSLIFNKTTSRLDKSDGQKQEDVSFTIHVYFLSLSLSLSIFLQMASISLESTMDSLDCTIFCTCRHSSLCSKFKNSVNF